jgi:hypothetical protein
LVLHDGLVLNLLAAMAPRTLWHFQDRERQDALTSTARDERFEEAEWPAKAATSAEEGDGTAIAAGVVAVAQERG